jgi:hypothetical protein
MSSNPDAAVMIICGKQHKKFENLESFSAWAFKTQGGHMDDVLL